MSQWINNPEAAKELLPRYRLFYLAVGVAFFIFSTRLWYLQVMQGSELREFSEKNRIKVTKIMAPRGLITDRDGKILVENHPGYELVLSPLYTENLEKVIAEISPIIGVAPDRIQARIERARRQNGPFALVRVADNLSREIVFRLKRKRIDLPGIDIRETVVRHYPLGTNGSQLFGYVGEISRRQIPIFNERYRGAYTFEQGDVVGKTGLEEILERDIRGRDGRQFVQVDAFGRETRTSTEIYGERLVDVDPQPGDNVTLTIDRDLQNSAYEFFRKTNRIGAVVALKSNGEVLAWVSTPSFDPNEFSRGFSTQLWSQLVNDPFRPLRNKVIQDHFSPGSTLKALVAVAALSEKIVTPDTMIPAPGVFRFGRRDYHDARREGHGNVNIATAIERSSNVFFYKMGIALGIDKMFNYISPMGIGQRSGIELRREAAGMMPNSQWKKANLGEEWQAGENLSNAIGQGFVLATPLQMAIAYNTIATRGKVVKPFVVKAIRDIDGKRNKVTEPIILRDLTQTQATGVKVEPAVFETVVQGLRGVVQGDHGTARHVNIPGADIAGKTGTSQVMNFTSEQIYRKCDSLPFHQRHHGWFVAFAPAEKPEITIAAFAEHACSGSGGAAPVVKEMMRTYFEKYHREKIAEYLKRNPRRDTAAEAVSIPATEGE